MQQLTVCEAKLIPRDSTPQNASDGLGGRIGALRSALLTDLVVADDVSRGEVCATGSLSQRRVFQYQLAEQARLAVVAIGAQPLLDLVNAGSDDTVCHRRARGNRALLVVAPRRGICEQLLRLGVFGSRDIVLQSTHWEENQVSTLVIARENTSDLCPLNHVIESCSLKPVCV